MIRQISWPIDIPLIIDASFLLNIQIRSCSYGCVNIFQWNRRWFFSTSKVWLLLQRDDEQWSFLTWTKNHLSLHWHPDMSLEGWKRPFWFCQRIYVTSSSNWVFPYQDGSSQFLISSRKFDSSICCWKWILLSLWEISPVLQCVFSIRFQMRPSFPTPQCLPSLRHPSKFSPRTERIRWTIQIRLSFQLSGFSTDPAQTHGDTQSVNETEWSDLWKVLQNVSRMECFPTNKRSSMFRW